MYDSVLTKLMLIISQAVVAIDGEETTGHSMISVIVAFLAIESQGG